MKQKVLALLLVMAMVLSMVPVGLAAAAFIDVWESDYYYDAVLWACENSITQGDGSAITFNPDGNCTRAQIVTFLWRYAGEPRSSTKNPFVDVKNTDYFYNAVLWAVEKGITAGTSANTFDPEKSCTRAQVASFLWRFSAYPSPSSSTNPFKDVSAKEYYYSAVLWAVENDITKGTENASFSPEATCTRAHIVTFLYRFKEIDANEDSGTNNVPITETKLSEIHTPNDAATYVTYTNWNVEDDLDITMSRYGGGIKVSVSNMFTSMGSGLEQAITSKLILSLYPANHTETEFCGVIVLDKSMYGSSTSGTIRMLVNNQEVFSTGEIDGSCETSFPFSIDITGADTIVIEADVVLRGSSFVYGIVDES